MNRELFLSLGITILTSATLFMYFRQRFKNIEHKVNTIFQMVQEHAKLQQMQAPRMVNRMMQHIPPMGVHSGRKSTSEELIEVSDDETSDSADSDEDSDDETASETSTTEQKQNPNSAPPQNIQMEQNLKQISVTLEQSPIPPINLAEKIDLDDVSSLEDNEEEEGKTEEVPHVVEETPDYAKMTVAELKKIASKKGITGYNKLRKKGLLDAILSN
jgi:hypothetical protein